MPDLPDLPILDFQDEESKVLSTEDTIGPLSVNVRLVPAGEILIGAGNFFEKSEDPLLAFGGLGEAFDILGVHLGHGLGYLVKWLIGQLG